jgi:hypothetical protein
MLPVLRALELESGVSIPQSDASKREFEVFD